MKTIFQTSLLALLLFCCTFQGQAQEQEWKGILPFADYHHYWDGYFNVEGMILLVGQEGRIMKSIDKGQTWVITDHLTEEDLIHIQMIPGTDEKTFLVASDTYLFKSIDGGDSWAQVSGVNFNDFIEMDVLSKNMIIASDRDETLLRSTDQGDSWESIVLSSEPTNLRDFAVLDENKAWTVSLKGKLFFTDDGGMNWDSLTKMPISSITQITFVDENIGYASANSSKFYKTTDGGLTWENQLEGTFTPRPVELVAKNENELYLITFYDSGIMYSEDGGANWTRKSASYYVNNRYQSIDVLEDGTIWMTGDYQTITSSDDNGASWTELFEADKFSKEFVTFSDQGVGISAGAGNEVYRSTDGGESWEDIAMVESRSSDIAVGKDGAFFISNTTRGIYRSLDNGENWEFVLDREGLFRKIVSAPNGTLFASEQNGSDNWIHRSVDNGTTWEAIETPMDVPIYQMEMMSDQIGFASKTNELIKTTDGGTNWELVTETFDGSFRSYNFLNDQIGWIATRTSFYKTSDGGLIWDSIGVNPESFLTGMVFKDEQVGWIIGGGTRSGTIYETIDGGATWTLDHKAPYALYDIEISDGEEEQLVACGAGGQMIYGSIGVVAGGRSPWETQSLTVYPNPGNDYIQFDQDFKNATLKIYNDLGQLVLENNWENKYAPQIDMSDLPIGKYYIQVLEATEIWATKWVKF